MSQTNFQKFYPTLRSLGFRLDYRSRHQDGECRIYEKLENSRTIEVQVYSNNGHRISHMTHHKDYPERKRCKTSPTYFSDIQSLIEGIEYETKRPDPFDEYLEDL